MIQTPPLKKKLSETSSPSPQFAFPEGLTLQRTRHEKRGRLLLASDVNRKQFRLFLEMNDLGPAITSCSLVNGEIWIDKDFENSSTESEIHAVVASWFNGAFYSWADRLPQLSDGVRLMTVSGGLIASEDNESRVDARYTWRLPTGRYRYIAVAVSYGVGLEATHAKMSDILQHPDVEAGIIVRIYYPLNRDDGKLVFNGNYFVLFYYPKPSAVNNYEVRANRMISFGDYVSYHDVVNLKSLVNALPAVEMEGNGFGPQGEFPCTSDNAGHEVFNIQVPAELTFSLDGQGTILNNFLNLHDIADKRLTFRLYRLKECIHQAIENMNDWGIQPPGADRRRW